jgi:hypothetical protein
VAHRSAHIRRYSVSSSRRSSWSTIVFEGTKSENFAGVCIVRLGRIGGYGLGMELLLCVY